MSMEDCTLCPRECHADRKGGKCGYCGQTDEIRAARAALHYWEEPCISGKKGSGAVFFSGCVLRCVYCQNREIAWLCARSGSTACGKEISGERLAEIFLELQEKHANNINLVTPTHFAPQIAEAIRRARSQGLRLPVVYNTGSYEKVETLKSLDGLVDIYLPDLKYVSRHLAERYSNAPDYFERASEAIAEMVRQTGEPVFGLEEESEDMGSLNKREEKSEGAGSLNGREEKSEGAGSLNGPEEESEDVGSLNKREEKGEGAGSLNGREKKIEDAGSLNGPEKRGEGMGSLNESGENEGYRLMKKGVIVRHLVLPGSVADSKRIIHYLHETYGNRIYISIMNQYTPMGLVDFPELNRKVRRREYEKVVDYALALGVENGFIQEGGTAEESFIPAFDWEGL